MYYCGSIPITSETLLVVEKGSLSKKRIIQIIAELKTITFKKDNSFGRFLKGFELKYLELVYESGVVLCNGLR